MNSGSATGTDRSLSGCQICGNRQANRRHAVREMMLGLAEEFSYLECAQCGCLQIESIPTDMARYYPTGYYSFDQHGWLATFLRRRRARHALQKRNFIGWLISELIVPHDALLAVRRISPPLDAAILDVGCGSGRLLLDMSWMGYRNLTGADPFIPETRTYPSGVRILKQSIHEVTGRFDLIMFHHSFEHMDSPQDVLAATYRLLSPGGRVIVRIPVASSFAWCEYGVHWVNLDAPRHFFLHTFASMKLLSEQVGLVLTEVRHEGNTELFWASEQYRAGIPMLDSRSLKSSRSGQLRMFLRLWQDRQRCLALNEQGQGDLVCFGYRKSD